MSTRNPNNWTKVRDTVRFWQESLVRLNFGARHQDRLEYAKKVLGTVGHCHDMTPPQSLGELCLTLAERSIRNCVEPYRTSPHTAEIFNIPLQVRCRKIILRGYRDSQISPLRRAMFRKNRDPEVVRYQGAADYFGWLYWKMKENPDASFGQTRVSVD